MPFHHQTAKNISSKKENRHVKLRIRSLDLLVSFCLPSLCHVVERIRFRANAVISGSQQGFQLNVNRDFKVSKQKASDAAFINDFRV